MNHNTWWIIVGKRGCCILQRGEGHPLLSVHYNLCLHIWTGTISADRYKHVSEQHFLACRWRLFQGRPFIFAKPHILKQLCIRRMQMVNCSKSAVQNLHQLKTPGTWWNTKKQVHHPPHSSETAVSLTCMCLPARGSPCRHSKKMQTLHPCFSATPASSTLQKHAF